MDCKWCGGPVDDPFWDEVCSECEHEMDHAGRYFTPDCQECLWDADDRHEQGAEQLPYYSDWAAAQSRIFMIQHIPGPMIQRVQKCSRCGEVLIDYRDASIAVHPGHPEDIGGWEVGHPILRVPGGGYAERHEADDGRTELGVDWVACSVKGNSQG